MATSLIPDGTSKDYKFSKKIINDELGQVYSDDSGDTLTSGTYAISYVANGFTGSIPSTRFGMYSYQAQNQPAIQIESPKPIQTVDRDLIATNHHSVYGYNGLTYSASGKVATGGSVEANGVDDLTIGVADWVFDTIGETVGVGKTGDTIFWKVQGTHPTDPFIKGCVYVRTGGGWNANDWRDTSDWELIGFTSTTPNHKIINLDNQSITASKALISQTSEGTQVFTQEISSGWDGTSTFEDDTTTGLTIGQTYKETTTGGLYVAIADKITVSDTATWSYPAAYNDTATFKQLTDGKTTDNSMNTIQTKVLYKASSIKV